MVSYLIFAVGLLCAGVVADSWNFGDDYGKRRSDEDHSKGLISITDLCNKCLRTVSDMTRMAKRKIEMETYRAGLYNCNDFKATKNEMGKKMAKTGEMRENGRFNLLDSKDLCAKYCAMKPRNKAKSRPIFVSSSNDRDWSGEPGKRRCRAEKNDDDVEHKDPSLDLAYKDPKCRDCVTIIRGFRDYIGDRKPQKFSLYLSCVDEQESLRYPCIDFLLQHSDTIIELLIAKKGNFEICVATQECHEEERYTFCISCQKYADLFFKPRRGHFDFAEWACSDSSDPHQCQRMLNRSEYRIRDLYHKNPNATPEEVCQKAHMCPLQ